MDTKRAKELINELSNNVDQIYKGEMTEEQKTEITVKVMAILNELDLRPTKYGE